MVIDDQKLKYGDQVVYRGYVATYEGDDLGSFTLAHEDNYEDVICFPSSLDEIINEVDDECGGIVFDDRYEVVIF